MDFGNNRPVRLSENTRHFAMESLLGKYGDDAMKIPYVTLDEIENYESLSPQEKYNVAITKIVSEAPIRICEHKTVSGAATLGAAISHVIPAYINGASFCPSISHLTLDFATVVKKGMDFLENKINARLK